MTTGTIATSVGDATVLHRLALGVECFDAVGDRPVMSRVSCGREAHRRELPRAAAPSWPCLDLDRADGGRFVLRHDRALPAPIVLRFDDRSRRYVPRRFSVDLWAIGQLDETQSGSQYVPVQSRLLRAWLWPGSAYPAPPGSTVVRGRVVRADGTAARWARLNAVGPDNATTGRAHADDRGEFLLVVTRIAQNPIESELPVDVSVIAPKAPAVLDPDDRCADLVKEGVPRSSVPPAPAELDNPVLRGAAAPPGYAANSNPTTHLRVPVGKELAMNADIVFVPTP